MKAERSLWRKLLEGWPPIAARFGEVQTLVLLGLVYALAFGPVSLGTSLARRDFLGKTGLRDSGTAFREADSSRPDLERAKRPF